MLIADRNRRLGAFCLLLALIAAGFLHAGVDALSDCILESHSQSGYSTGHEDEHHCEPGEDPSRQTRAAPNAILAQGPSVPSAIAIASVTPDPTPIACAKPRWHRPPTPWVQRVGLRLYA